MIDDTLKHMSMFEYIELKEKQISEAWHLARRSGHEFYKGQFLLLREILTPSYRHSINFEAIERDEKRLEEEANLPWHKQKHMCGICIEEMVENHGSNDEEKEVYGFRCPRCDSILEITIPHEPAKTPRWKN